MKLTPPAPPRPCRVLNSPSLLPPHTHNPTHHPHSRSSLISPSPISLISPSLISHHLSIIFSSSSPRQRSGPSRGRLKRFRNSSRFPTTKADSRCRHTFKHTTGRRPSICIRGRELLDVDNMLETPPGARVCVCMYVCECEISYRGWPLLHEDFT